MIIGFTIFIIDITYSCKMLSIITFSGLLGVGPSPKIMRGKISFSY